MEPTMTWGTLALAVWPLWLVLAALGVWWLLARHGYAPADTYEEPPPVQPNDSWMTAEERDYHKGGGFNRE